jgi:hypothetical protein
MKSNTFSSSSAKESAMQTTLLAGIDSWTDRVCHRVDELLESHGVKPGPACYAAGNTEEKMRIV